MHLYQPCPHHNALGRNPCRLCNGIGFVKVGLTVGQLERMVDTERTLAGDPGIPAERRRATLIKLVFRAQKALEELQ